MTERDFAAELANVEGEMNALLGPMAQAAEAWLQLVIPWTQRIWADVIRKIIAEPSNAARIAEMRDYDLQTLRRAADAVTDGAEDFLRRTLIDDVPGDWPHLKPQTSVEEFASQSAFRQSPFSARNRTGPLTAPSHLQAETRSALGAIAAPFAAAGLIPPPYFRPQADTWDVTNAPDWTPAMCEAIEHYSELHVRLVELIKVRAAVLRDETISVAQTRWEEAAHVEPPPPGLAPYTRA